MLLFLLLAGAAAFFASMAVFVSQHTELACSAQPVSCERVETYPFGVEIRTEVLPFTQASTRVKSGGRRSGTSLDLVLIHVDGTATEYPGVGTNGDRAAESAEQLNAFLAAPRSPLTLELRSGSVAVAVFMLLLALGAVLVLIAIFLLRVSFIPREDDQLEVRVSRWPLPARTRVFSRDRLRSIDVRLQGSGRYMRYQLFLLIHGSPDVDLGIASSIEGAARSKAAELEAIIASWRGDTGSRD